MKRFNIGNADFEFQRGRDPVERHEAIRILALPMLVQIDEARGDNQSARIDRPSAVQRFGGNPRDRVSTDSYVAHSVQVGLRVNDSAGLQHEVERLPSARAGGQPA